MDENTDENKKSEEKSGFKSKTDLPCGDFVVVFLTGVCFGFFLGVRDNSWEDWRSKDEEEDISDSDSRVRFFPLEERSGCFFCSATSFVAEMSLSEDFLVEDEEEEDDDDDDEDEDQAEGSSRGTRGTKGFSEKRLSRKTSLSQ